jgi:hypothetical protein
MAVYNFTVVIEPDEQGFSRLCTRFAWLSYVCGYD